MLAGQAMVGDSVSTTVTLKEHRFVLPLASVAVQMTVVTPLLKYELLTGLQTTAASGQLSKTVAE